MTVEILRDWPAFLSLEAEWNDLLGRSRAETIFLTWEWIRSWIEISRKSVQPFVVVVREKDGNLVGVAPFYKTEFRLAKLLHYRFLRLMADYPTGSDYPDWIIREDCEVPVSREIVEALAECRGDWDCIWMPSVKGWAGSRESILRACQERRFYHHVRSRDFAFLKLPDTFDAYMKALSQNKRQQLRKEMRRVAERSGVTITRCSTPDELSGFLDALFDLHYRRRNRVGDEGTFRRKPAEAQFYRQFAPLALARGWLRLFGLKEQGAFKAVQIGYVYDKVFHQMQEGFDPDYVPGTGNVLRAKVIESCIGEGVRAVDFLGGMTDHKRRWLAEERVGWDLFIGNHSFKNRLLFAGEIWPTGRFLRPVRGSSPEVREGAHGCGFASQH